MTQMHNYFCSLNILFKHKTPVRLFWNHMCNKIPLLFLPRTRMARRVRRPSSSRVGAPAATEKSLLLSLISERRATLPALRLEATREERCAQLYLLNLHTTHNIQHQRVTFSHYLWSTRKSCRNSELVFALYHRPGCLVPTKRAAITGSRAPPQATKVISATSPTTKATARRGKMCESPHRKTSADRGHLTCPSFLSLCCCQTPALGGC